MFREPKDRASTHGARHMRTRRHSAFGSFCPHVRLVDVFAYRGGAVGYGIRIQLELEAAQGTPAGMDRPRWFGQVQRVGRSVQRQGIVMHAFGSIAVRVADDAMVGDLDMVPGAKPGPGRQRGIHPAIPTLAPDLPQFFALIPLKSPHQVQLSRAVEQECVVFQRGNVGGRNRVDPKIRVYLRAGIASLRLVRPQNVGVEVLRIQRLRQEHGGPVDRGPVVAYRLVGHDGNTLAARMTIRLGAGAPVGHGIVGVGHDDLRAGFGALRPVLSG